MLTRIMTLQAQALSITTAALRHNLMYTRSPTLHSIFGSRSLLSCNVMYNSGSTFSFSSSRSISRMYRSRSSTLVFGRSSCSSRNIIKSGFILNQKQQCLSCISLKLRNEIWNLPSSWKSGRNSVLNYSSSPFNVNSNIAQDALVFSHKNENFFKFLSLFGLVQMLMWGYLSLFSAQGLKSGPVIKKDTSDLPWWQKLLYTEGRYKNAISLLCFTVGASIFFITLTYPRRAVKQMWLLKGGRDVKIISHGWFGKTHTLKTPVEHISCYHSRSGSGSQVSLKIKNKYFFYLIDKQGNFHNPELFDFVIALKRNL